MCARTYDGEVVRVVKGIVEGMNLKTEMAQELRAGKT